MQSKPSVQCHTNNIAVILYLIIFCKSQRPDFYGIEKDRIIENKYLCIFICKHAR